MKTISLNWQVTNTQDGQLLRSFLRDEKHLSRKALADVKFKGGKITVNGEEVNVRTVLKSGDDVTVFFPPEERSENVPLYSLPLHIVFEDEHILVINKQAGLPTIPSRDPNEPSLAGAVLAYYDECDIQTTFHAVNRLDKDTSGVILIAKHRYIHDRFVQMQKENKIKRSYMAIVHGKMNQLKGTVDASITRKEGSIIERKVSDVGQRALTHFQVEQTTTEGTLVRLELETGRTHQIRVHMNSIGHPLQGDTLYGGRTKYIDRQALHARSINFVHPIKEEEMFLEAPLPKDMKNVLTALKAKS
ncbi:RluA family pseudouridine synthase [Bacillus shivajii]|uniref:RluA family pseudouridine synthase n=1 Tax=Bacillus shivajii TaxID=1983719 RepID=UPI001CF9BDE5|nr:RluA family pseudouridine synthase [Bacillus shivajii]UCZ51945.1 RluA family pseudouridine synthase [Bacillus shivajii]